MNCSYPNCGHKAHYQRVVIDVVSGVKTYEEQAWCNDHWWTIEEKK